MDKKLVWTTPSLKMICVKFTASGTMPAPVEIGPYFPES